MVKNFAPAKPQVIASSLIFWTRSSTDISFRRKVCEFLSFQISQFTRSMRERRPFWGTLGKDPMKIHQSLMVVEGGHPMAQAEVEIANWWYSSRHASNNDIQQGCNALSTVHVDKRWRKLFLANLRPLVDRTSKLDCIWWAKQKICILVDPKAAK